MKAGLVLIRANLPPHTDLQPFFTWFVSMLIKFLVKATREAFSGKRMYASFCFLFQFKIFFSYWVSRRLLRTSIWKLDWAHTVVGFLFNLLKNGDFEQAIEKWKGWHIPKTKTSCFEFRTSSKKYAWLCLFWSDRVGMVTETKHELIGWKVFFITLEGTLI